MWAFLAEFIRRDRDTYTIVVMDEEGVDPPRQYRVHPRQVLRTLAGALSVMVLLAMALAAFSPLEEIIPGATTADMRDDAREHAVRLAALEDSLAVQEQYITQLRRLMTGQIDTSVVLANEAPPSLSGAATGELAEVAAEPPTENWTDHQQPALSIQRMPAVRGERPPVRTAAAEGRYLSNLSFPVMPPVQGLLTRGFDARASHFAVDIAVEEGTIVRAIGDGYVILADWTHDGGYTTAVQHADGFVSVYKHNQRLLKRVGDRVRDRDAVAVSGNSGEISTGPHLHFELWRNGLAQDPRYFLIGW